MIHKLSRGVIGHFLKRNIISSEEAEIYAYGFELIISSVIGFLIILTAGLVFGILIESLVFYIIFVSVRPFTGGFHADTHLRCKITFIIVYILVMLMTKLFEHNYHLSYHFLIITICVLSIILYAPVENPNKPLDEAEKKHNRIISIIISAVLSVVSLLTGYFSIKYALLIILTLFSVSTLMIIAKINSAEAD